MSQSIRIARMEDAAECGRILFTAFQSLADHHNFSRDFPSVEVATNVTTMLLGHPGYYGVVAEQDGRILGSNFMDQRLPIAGIGPITIDPAVQNKGLGNALMKAAMDHATALGAAGIRLVQAAYHNRSLSLYTRLGFRTREPLSLLQGAPLNLRFTGYAVRPATEADVAACGRLCLQVHGFTRDAQLRDAISQGDARVVEHLGRITGYASTIGFRGHAVAETNQDLKALIADAAAISGPGFLLPSRNHEVLAWCLENGLRLVMQMTLMSTGFYNEPNGAYLPSIHY